MSRSRHSFHRQAVRAFWAATEGIWSPLPADLWTRFGKGATKLARNLVQRENRNARRELLSRSLKAINSTGETDHPDTEPKTAAELEKRGRRYFD